MRVFCVAIVFLALALTVSPARAGTSRGVEEESNHAAAALLLVGGAILLILDINRNRSG